MTDGDQGLGRRCPNGLTRRGLLASLPLLPGLPVQSDPRDSFALEIMAGPRRLTLNGVGSCGQSRPNGLALVAGLYLEAPSHDPAAIGRAVALVVLRHRRAATLAQVVGGWQEVLGGGLPPAFRAWLRPVEPGDVEHQAFGRDGVRLQGPGRTDRAVPDPDFTRLLLSVWIGDAAPNPAMRRGLLGLES